MRVKSSSAASELERRGVASGVVDGEGESRGEKKCLGEGA